MLKVFLSTVYILLSTASFVFAVDVAVTVEKMEKTSNQKIALQVRIDQRLDKEQLEKLGRKLHADRCKGFKLTFIQYRLSDQPLGTDLWGVTNFVGDKLESATINGLTPQQVKELSDEKYRATGQVIGDWLVDSPPSRMLIYRVSDKLVLEMRFGDDASDVEPLTETQDGKRTLYRCTNRPNSETVYLVNAAGDLEIRDLKSRDLLSVGKPTHPEDDRARQEEGKKAIASKKLLDDEAKAESQLKLGLNLSEKGNNAAALKYFRKVVDEWPNTKAADAARKQLKKLDVK